MARLPATADIGDTTIPKVVVGANHRLAYISRSVIPNATKSSLRPVYFRQIGLYGYGRSALEQYGRFGRRGTCEQYEDIEILRFLDLGLPVSMLELDDYGPAVDLPEHIAAVEAHLARRGA
jgi:3-deoxy-manno-octulosonate cytidylyltransferase (CMP-KDO synthetase)